MNNRTAFAKATNERTQIEHNACGRRAAVERITIVVMTLFFKSCAITGDTQSGYSDQPSQFGLRLFMPKVIQTRPEFESGISRAEIEYNSQVAREQCCI